MRASIHIDVAPDVRAPFIDHDNALLLGHLEDFHRIRCGHQPWTARRQTKSVRVIERTGRFSLGGERRSPGLVRDFFRVDDYCGVVLVLRGRPVSFIRNNAAEVWGPILEFRRRWAISRWARRSHLRCGHSSAEE